MKILLFGPTHPIPGGVPLFTETLHRKLREAGHSVETIGFKRLSPALFARVSVRPAQFFSATSVKQVFTPWAAQTWQETARTIVELKPDLILTMWWLPLLATGYRAVWKNLPRELQKRWVYVVHDVVSHERWPGDTIFARSGLSIADKLLVLSRNQERRLRKLLPSLKSESAIYAPHPLYDEIKKYAGSKDEARRALGVAASRVLLFFGFVRRYKGLDILLRAMPQILQDYSDTQLLVCGPFHQSRTKYERLIYKLGIEKAVVIHDRYFTGDEIALCFAAADVVILPYRKATQSGVIPMAYALETPVIATRVDGLEEYIEDNETGFLITPDDPAAIANMVREFFDAGGKSAFLNEINCATGRYSWNSFITAIEGLVR